MDMNNCKEKKGLIIKTWERWRSIHGAGGKKRPWGIRRDLTIRTRSWRRRPPSAAAVGEEKRAKKRRLAPEGCFSVYVGPQKQRFVIRTEYANHPLFKMLLEEAESEYGYNSQGPLVLLCNVDHFCKVLVEMNSDELLPRGCGFLRAPAPIVFSFHLF
ncbi:hypothetical protein U1Q18_028952 [Sarracenia purpurea var. burkii]